MLKLQIYVNNIFIFKISVPPDTILRQLIAIISVKYNELKGGKLVFQIENTLLPYQLINYYPVFNDEKGEKLFSGNYFKRSELNLCITKTSGLNLKDNDAIYVNDETLAKEFNLSFIYHVGKPWKPFFDRCGIGEEEFIQAAKYGDVVTLEELLSLKLSFMQYRLNDALLVATTHNQINAVKLLLYAGAKSDWMADSFFLAVLRNYLEIVNLLVIHGAASPNPDSKHDRKTLRRLVSTPQMLKYLLENGLIPFHLNEQVFYINHYIANFFESAMRGIYPTFIQNIIIQYALPNVTDPNFNLSDLIKFSLAFYFHLMKPLSSFKNKTDVHLIKIFFHDVNYSLPPKTLKQQLQLNMSKMICISNPMLAECFQSILYQLGNDEINKAIPMQLSIPQKTDAITLAGHSLESVVKYCIENYVVDILKKNIRMINDIKEDWIIQSLQYEQVRSQNGIVDDEKISEILLKKKFGAITFAVKLRLRDQKLHLAVIKNDIDTVKNLLKEGATLNTSIYYNHETTPVHLAIEYRHLSLLEFLISVNADLNCKDKNNRTSLELAYQKNDPHILTLLIQGGAYQTQFKSLHPIFVSQYVGQFFEFILDEILPKKTPIALINEILQYILNENDFKDVGDFFMQVKNFNQMEFKYNAIISTILPPKVMRHFLFFQKDLTKEVSATANYELSPGKSCVKV